MEHINHQMANRGGEEPKPDGGGEESNPAENQTNGDIVTESDKEPPLAVLQEITSPP
jgi:hypothetical protein